MTMDSQGDIWSARWDGSCIQRYSGAGKEKEKIKFPVLKVSSVIFGGPELTDMYVTTAGGDQKEKDGPTAGALYRVKTTIKGTPEFSSKIVVK